MDQQKNHYRESGVDAARGDELVEWMQNNGKLLSTPNRFGKVIDGIGGFAGIFSLAITKFKKPALVASTDGVGTKLLLGLSTERIENIGQDLVAMCVNDLYTVGAIPLFFLDYYATGHLMPEQFKSILSSIKLSCDLCQMALLGGETAEMPGLYAKGHFDLAGFVVGVVDEEDRLGPHRTQLGDKVVAFGSSGFHSNGFSLIRKWLADKPRPDLIEKLMTPTRLYNAIPELFARRGHSLHALANITGGGISGNLPRVLKQGLNAQIDFKKLPTPEWMKDFIKSNDVSLHDVEEVFNLGVGMIAITDAKSLDDFIRDAAELGLEPHLIGELVAGTSQPLVTYD